MSRSEIPGGHAEMRTVGHGTYTSETFWVATGAIVGLSIVGLMEGVTLMVSEGVRI